MTELMNDRSQLPDRPDDATMHDRPGGSPAPDYLPPKGFRLIPLIVPLAAVTLLIGGMVILSTAGA